MSFVAQSVGSDFERLIDFFEELLRSESDCKIQNEYPLVFDPDQTGLITIDSQNKDYLKEEFLSQLDKSCRSYICLFEEDSVIKGGLGILQRTLEIAEGKTAKFIFVGSVVTREEFRQQGVQRELFHLVDKIAEVLKIDFIALWSNQVDFYRKLGFELGGMQATWSYPYNSKLGDPSIPVSYGLCSEVEFTKDLYESFCRKKMRAERSFEEMNALWSIPRMQVACTDKAYALMGKGEDFEGVCHEWAGPSKEVLSCIQRLRDENKNLRILSPGVMFSNEEREVTRELEAQSFEPRLEYLGLLKVMSSDFTVSDLDPKNLKYPFFIWGLDSI